ncbi:DUF1284 domain-containing protein [Rhizobium sp. RU36D]|uniref:DUF1284 domain-containing protein n=1 Tax=Rhizobium sp. RU36D TaxID=1907415 RepID=UPI0009D9046E|nr:DUF1284 domain-containing protein [Rhizobium sp. RU36D]SMC90853.1 hypothetical protein SAMN05880593_11012 [Rhizobium sp. RU36D]
MTVRLRAHHLLCMLTYVGKGYSPAFVANYDAISARLSAGEEIELVAGPDDVCAPLLGDAHAHCRGESVIARDEAARRAIAEEFAVSLETGALMVPTAPLLARLRQKFAAGTLRRACAGCEWTDLCDRVAAQGYPDVRIVLPEQGAGREEARSACSPQLMTGL